MNRFLNLMNENKQDFVNYTKEVWQPYYEEELSENDAVEIIDNMTTFMNLLIKWDKAEKEKQSCKISVIHKKRGAKNE